MGEAQCSRRTRLALPEWRMDYLLFLFAESKPNPSRIGELKIEYFVWLPAVSNYRREVWLFH
ncbi:MAG: hypothetical protein P1U77_21860 [Rubripirellula sp.]|nr:hypothetical protein [Rubripirellula sp.]